MIMRGSVEQGSRNFDYGGFLNMHPNLSTELPDNALAFFFVPEASSALLQTSTDQTWAKILYDCVTIKIGDREPSSA